MVLKLIAMIISVFMVNACNETDFPTKIAADNTTQTTSQSSRDESIVSLDRVNSDIKRGKVKGWKDAQSQQDRYLVLLNYFRSLPIKCNDSRAYKGPQPGVEWDDSLESAAIDHSEDLLEHSVLGHKGSNGSSAAQRVHTHGFEGEYIGENVGYKMKDGIAYSGKEWIELFVGWMQSKDGHCSNIMSPEYNAFGMGEAKSIESNSVTLFWTQDFGKY